jgi:hypothetical protein
MTVNTKLLSKDQQAIRKYGQISDHQTFQDLLNHPELLVKIKKQTATCRERFYSPCQTLSMFIKQALSSDRSCQKAVNDVMANRALNGMHRNSIATGGYCRARQRLPVSLISELTYQTGELIDRQLPKHWLWGGRRVLLVDGTTLSLPDTPENQAVYPQSKNQKPGLGFPLCRLVGMINLSSGVVVNMALGSYSGKGTGEQSLLRKILYSINKNDVIVGDAYYGSYFLLQALIQKGADVVFEQFGARKRKKDFRKGKSLGVKDHLIVLQKPTKKPDWMTPEAYDSSPETLTIRELEVGKKILITTMLSPEMASKASLKILYKERWHIEVDFRSIKDTLGLGILSCKTPEMCEKEIWIYFLAYNLIRLLMVQAALQVDCLPRQISFKHTVQLCLAWIQQKIAVMNAMAYTQLLYLIAQRRVGGRPGRIEPRAIKRRPKPFPLLMEARDKARKNIIKNGHPKK